MVETSSGAGAAFQAVYDQWERERLASQLRALTTAFAEYFQAIGRDWEVEAGQPIPSTIEGWERLAVRAGISPDKLWDGEWTIGKITPSILGYLDRIRDASRPEAAETEDEPCRHSDDFRSVNWHGEQFSFTRNQAACVKALWAAWEAKTPELDGLTLIVKADVSQTQLKDVFKRKDGMHPAWGTLVISGETKGSYRLTDGPINSAVKKGRKKVPRKTPRKTPR